MCSDSELFFLVCWPSSEWTFLGNLVAICATLIWNDLIFHLQHWFIFVRYEITTNILTPYLGWLLLLHLFFHSLLWPRTYFGAPLSRRRIFILMIRCDCLRELGMSLDDYVLEKVKNMKQPMFGSWYLVIPILLLLVQIILADMILSSIRQSLLLPDDYWAIKQDKRDRERARRNNADKQLGLTIPFFPFWFSWCNSPKGHWTVLPSGFSTTGAGLRTMRFLGNKKYAGFCWFWGLD